MYICVCMCMHLPNVPFRNTISLFSFVLSFFFLRTNENLLHTPIYVYTHLFCRLQTYVRLLSFCLSIYLSLSRSIRCLTRAKRALIHKEAYQCARTERYYYASIFSLPIVSSVTGALKSRHPMRHTRHIINIVVVHFPRNPFFFFLSTALNRREI